VPATAEDRSSAAVFSYSAIVEAKTKSILQLEPIAYFPRVGERFFGFDLIAELGSGTFGHVYLAKQPAIGDRLVALKVSSDIGGECHALSQLRHTNIVPIYSVHEDESRPNWKALCMPYLGATTLQSILGELQTLGMPHKGSVMAASWRKLKTTVRNHVEETLVRPAFQGAPPSSAEKPRVKRHRLARALTTFERMETESYVDAVLEIAAALADGLAHAHDQGILHRDLKPANVIVTDDGEPMLVDFNLSEDVKERSESLWSLAGGTLPYMSPEQIDEYLRQPAEVDQRSDLYSLGVIVFELLTGKLPFASAQAGESIWEDARVARTREAPSARTLNRAVSRRVDVVIRKCLECKPEDRYRTARELHDDLKCCLTGRALIHGRDPFFHERVGQWAERHGPKIFAGGLTVFAAVCAFAFHSLGEFEARRDTAASFASVRPSLDRNRFALAEAVIQRGRFEDLRAKTVAQFEAFDDGGDLSTNPSYRRLAEDERRELRQRILETSVLMAGSHLIEARAGVRDSLLQAEHWIERVERFAGSGTAWKSVALLRAMLAETSGAADAVSRRRIADAADPADGGDAMLCALALVVDRRFEAALDCFRAYEEQLKDRLFCAFLAGFCLRENGDLISAVRAWKACADECPLTPQFHRLIGLSRLRFAKSSDAAKTIDNLNVALQSLDAAVALDGTDVESLLGRAVAYKSLNRFSLAIQDIRDVQRLGFSEYYEWSALLRLTEGVRARTPTHDQVADEATEKLKTVKPVTADDWIEIGRYGASAEERLEGYERALALRPWSLAAIDGRLEQMIALGVGGERSREAVERARKIAGDVWIARAKCGRLLALNGFVDEAYAEAECVLEGKTSVKRRIAAATEVFEQIALRKPQEIDRIAARLQKALDESKVKPLDWRKSLDDRLKDSPQIAQLAARMALGEPGVE
jgi:eukaryotic-like serine/threonine-protein kinase